MRATYFGEVPPFVNACGRVELGQDVDGVECLLGRKDGPEGLVHALSHIAAN